METTTSLAEHPVELVEAIGRWGSGTATVYLPSRSDVVDAEHRFDIRRRNAIGLLEEAGASAATVATVTAVLERHSHDDGAGLIVVARDDDLVLECRSRHPLDGTHVAVSPLPQLLPLAAAAQADITHLAVLLDRTGADRYHRRGPGATFATAESEGGDHRIHRSHPGGWSQRRFQQIAENAWERNARDVVDDIMSGDDMSGDDMSGKETAGNDQVGIVVVGGDERAVGFFAQHLPERLRPPVHVSGSRHGDHEAFLDAADTAIADVAARRMTALLRDTRGAVEAGRGAAGEEVLDLLGQGRVARVVIGDDTFDAGRPWSTFDFEAGVHTGPRAQGGTRESNAAAVAAPVTDAALHLAHRRGVESIVAPPAGLRVDPPLLAVLHG